MSWIAHTLLLGPLTGSRVPAAGSNGRSPLPLNPKFTIRFGAAVSVERAKVMEATDSPEHIAQYDLLFFSERKLSDTNKRHLCIARVGFRVSLAWRSAATTSRSTDATGRTGLFEL